MSTLPNAHDEIPFAPDDGVMRAFFEVASGPGTARSMAAEAEYRTTIQKNACEWAERRGFVVDASNITCTEESVTVSVPLQELFEGMALLRATARLPIPASLIVQPKTWLQRHRVFGIRPPVLVDDEFERRWLLDVSDGDAVRRILDERCRAALCAGTAWHRLSYREGEIEVRVDADPLTGAHLLEGIDIAVAAASTRADDLGVYR